MTAYIEEMKTDFWGIFFAYLRKRTDDPILGHRQID